MPLRVHCPSGCLIRMPSNRAGKVVRCPECKKVIRLGKASVTEIASGKPIPMQAATIKDSTSIGETAIESTDLPSIDATSELETELPEIAINTGAPPATADRPRLEVPEQIKPPSVRRKTRNAPQAKPKPATMPKLPAVPLSKPTNNGPSIVDPLLTTSGMSRRVSSANSDRALISKLFAVFLCLVALVHFAPAAYFWYEWSQTFESGDLPRWIYLQAFVAAFHLMYAVYLVQIEDWSSLKLVAFAMLAVAFTYGAVSTGLLAGGGQGVIAQFLEIPHVLNSKACIWCVAMLCLATLMCYVGGKVAVNWQRTEQLMAEINSINA